MTGIEPQPQFHHRQECQKACADFFMQRPGIQGGQDKVNQIVEQGLSKDVKAPIAGVWLQDWCGTHSQVGNYVNISRLWWNWENDEVLYPDWPKFVDSLRDNHKIRTLSYMNVFLANVSTKV